MFDNGFGIFIRSASNGTVATNNAHDNCLGILFLSEPDPDKHWVTAGNQVNHNNKVCPGGDDTPPISGGGIVVFGGENISLRGNKVNGNAPAGPSFVSGGIVLVAGSSGTTVIANTARGNAPADLIDQSGSSNYFSANRCDTSIPTGLCGHTVTTDPSTTTPPSG